MANTIHLDGLGFSAPFVTSEGVFVQFDSYRIRSDYSAHYNGFSDNIRKMIHELKDNSKNIVGNIKITDKGLKLVSAFQNGLDQSPIIKQKINNNKALLQQELTNHGKKNPDKLKDLDADVQAAKNELSELFSHARMTIQAIVDDINAIHFSK